MFPTHGGISFLCNTVLGEKCVVNVEEFKILCLNKDVLTNVLIGLHETRGAFLEKNISNR